jgi:F-type H+-transporting ATPase subunit delta
MLSSIIAERYAKALLAAAEHMGELDSLLPEAAALKTALESDPELARALKRPLGGSEAKAAAFAKALEKKVSKVLVQFLRVVFENKREAFLAAMLGRLQDLADEKRSKMKAEVTSAFQLSAAQLKTLGAGLSQKFGREVELTPVVNRAMLGGLRLKVGDKVYDGSLESKLQRLERKLVEDGTAAVAEPEKKKTAKPAVVKKPVAKKASPKKISSKKPTQKPTKKTKKKAEE